MNLKLYKEIRMSNKENIENVLEFAKYKHFGQKRMDGSHKPHA